MHIMEMIRSHPVMPQFELDDMRIFLRIAAECGQTCVSCADACLAEKTRDQLVRCISINLDCADISLVTQRIVMRQGAPDIKLIQSQVQTFAMACRSCREECARHAAMHEHCRICAEVCARCEEACARLLRFFPATVAQDSR
ncbi:four-helix bundle copper-binding protein [Geobacter sp. SVR]|uniref:four-helix bundle copper-binding protein n=1 Tax=Geobacter sp. SVR TaxID=2495594 RepID=UPI00143EF70E|nr:four-helix bundle copper-binding protein [Geobacter sp. SVR]BCS53562.1 hypothetical protein GSVR_18700 [Geobacter sp. SVR]GCF84241.1 hypothetical protein GSbR_08410 [Geobacter sp. SVR]